MKRILCYAAVLVMASTAAVRAETLDEETIIKAGHGDFRSLRKFFEESLRENTASSVEYERHLREIFSTVGTQNFTRVLKSEPAQVRSRVLFFLNAALASH